MKRSNQSASDLSGQLWISVQVGVPHRSWSHAAASSQCSGVSIHGVSSVHEYVANASTRISAAVRSVYEAANTIAMSPHSDVAMIAARSDPAASITTLRSSVSSPMSATWDGEKRSEQPSRAGR